MNRSRPDYPSRTNPRMARPCSLSSSGAARPLNLASLPSRQRGSTVTGVIVGLLVGLVLAVVVAVFVMKSPGPFVEKVKRPGEVSTEPGALPDPNKGLSKAKGQESPGQEGASPSGEAPKADGSADARATATPGVTQTPAGAATPEAPAAPQATPAAVPVPPPVLTAPAPQTASPAEPPAERAADKASSYLLQVAAYRSQEDAESTKGRLALVGLEAAIARAEVNGTTFWRVRVGPFKDIDEANRARTRLSENGFDSSIIRLR